MKNSKNYNKLLVAFLGLGLIFSACKKEGCTDPAATNYNSKANQDDGSCVYDDDDTPGVPGSTIEIDENITTATTWAAGNYKICSDIRVESSLTINPGVNVIMCAGASLSVKESGSITAVGTASQGIVFRGEEGTPGYWEGIGIESNNPNNKFNYVTVRDAGSYWGWEYANVFVKSLGRLSIENSTFSNSEGHGIYAQASATFPTFSGNTLSNNVYAGLNISVDQVKALDNATAYNVSNGEAHVLVRGDYISSATTWSVTATPLLIVGSVNIENALTLNPGVHIKMESGDGIHVRESGSLNAMGTVDLPITIEGRYDSPGYWAGLKVASNNPNNKFNYVTVSDGGSYWGYEYAGIMVDGRLDLDNCMINNSNSWGVYVKGSSFLYCGGAIQTDAAGVTSHNTVTGNGVGPDADCVDGCVVYFE